MDFKALRREPRIPFESVVDLVGATTTVRADVCDLSRSGCRLLAPLAAFGLGNAPALPDVLDAIQVILGRHFEMLILPRGGGEGVRCVGKSAVLVRMSIVGGDKPGLDLGCLFSEPVHEEEARRLSVRIPTAQDDLAGRREGIDWKNVDGHGSRSDGIAKPVKTRARTIRRGGEQTEGGGRRLVARPKQRHEGSLARRRKSSDAPGPMYCQTETITPHAVLVRAENAIRNLGLRPGADLTTAAQAFTARFGEALHFSIGPSSDPLWAGSASVCGFELPDDSVEDLVITLTFERALDTTQMARVGLA